jgi:beta-N-acetylhexosaminidase
MHPMTLREKIGQMIMTGFPERKITTELLALIKEYKISNIILFSYNLENSQQIHTLCKTLDETIREHTNTPSFIAVDQEGGVVSRLPNEMINIPGAMLIGAAGDKKNSYLAGKITGEELKALGINVDLAPVLDVNSNPENPVIGVRSYSSDPDMVAGFGVGMMKGLKSGGVMPVVKHFPGHGDTAVDSHLGLPVIDKDLNQLLECELIPFRKAIAEGVPCVMSSHILFPKLDSQDRPATMSKSILTDLLRNQLGFQGIIMTDCMEMGAIKDTYGTAYGVVEAIKAGAQMICISHTPKLVKEAVHQIEQAVENGEISIDRIDAAVENILKYKNSYQNNFQNNNPEIFYSETYKKQVKEMVEAGITKVSEEELPEVGKKTIFIGSYAYRSTLATSAVNKELHFANYMAKEFHGTSIDVPVNPGEEDIDKVLEETDPDSLIVYGLYNGHMNQGQIKLVNALHAKGNPVIAITLRNPTDLSMLHNGIHKISAYEYNETVFEALTKVLKKEIKPAGKLPVEL